MATTTTNFGWDIPQSTDLVKDGATAIAALGQDIDTALVDLKGGTTGQVLAKASNTDLDYSWVAQDDSNAIQNAIVDAKGDLIGATAADTPARLAVGTNGQVLTADSTAATGLAWATPASSASGLTLIKTQTIGSGVSTVSVTDIFSSTYDNYLLTVSGGVSSSGTNISLRLGTTSTGYYAAGMYIQYGSSTVTGESVSNHSAFYAAAVGSTNSLNGEVQIFSPNLAKNTQVLHRASEASTAGPFKIYGGYLADTTQYTSVTIFPNSGTLTGGTIKVYGYQNS